MINIYNNRERYILKPTVPDGTETITYEVSIAGTTIFVGKTRYFGGTYEVDCSDWIDSYIQRNNNTSMLSVVVQVVFTFDNGQGSTQTQTMQCSWSVSSVWLNKPATTGSEYAVIQLYNSGFIHNSDSGHFYVPLDFRNGILEGKTIDKLEKVNYIDRYGDSHNGSMTNRYELECYIDPCWLFVKTGDDNTYEKVMMALQNAKRSVLLLKGVSVSGIYNSSPQTAWTLEGKVKDIERVETYSSYSVERRIPTYKITFEVYK